MLLAKDGLYNKKIIFQKNTKKKNNIRHNICSIYLHFYKAKSKPLNKHKW